MPIKTLICSFTNKQLELLKRSFLHELECSTRLAVLQRILRKIFFKIPYLEIYYIKHIKEKLFFLTLENIAFYLFLAVPGWGLGKTFPKKQAGVEDNLLEVQVVNHLNRSPKSPPTLNSMILMILTWCQLCPVTGKNQEIMVTEVNVELKKFQRSSRFVILISVDTNTTLALCYQTSLTSQFTSCTKLKLIIITIFVYETQRDIIKFLSSLVFMKAMGKVVII